LIGLAATLLAACNQSATDTPADTDESQDAGYLAPRDTYGQPDLNGIWQAIGAAHWGLEAHAARMGPVVALGALGAIPAGLSVVVDGEIPYQPWAREQQQENLNDWLARDPAVKCFMPGVPRANYMPYPFQIVQTPRQTTFLYEYVHAIRNVYMEGPHPEGPIQWWLGDSRGRWEGDTLVVDVVHFTDQTWLDRSGNYHSDALHVVERYTRVGPDHLWYEAAIEDPEVFTRPWKIGMPLYRRMEPNAQLMDFKCVEFVEELIYGRYRRNPLSQ